MTTEIVDHLVEEVDGYYEAQITASVSVNSAGDPFSLYTETECMGRSCDTWVEPFEWLVSTTIDVEVGSDEEGATVVDATVGGLTIDTGPTGAEVTLDGCGTAMDALEFMGIDLVEVMLPSIEDMLISVLDDLFWADVETAIEACD
jgi:hypothetical protein